MRARKKGGEKEWGGYMEDRLMEEKRGGMKNRGRREDTQNREWDWVEDVEGGRDPTTSDGGTEFMRREWTDGSMDKEDTAAKRRCEWNGKWGAKARVDVCVRAGRESLDPDSSPLAIIHSCACSPSPNPNPTKDIIVLSASEDDLDLNLLRLQCIEYEAERHSLQEEYASLQDDFDRLQKAHHKLQTNIYQYKVSFPFFQETGCWCCAYT
ncbi:hypothetical protein DFH09DRAFT_1096403 [Mycena vulgaris]|nr:hypothetical protein DFH09DRAFT_1096403 [Mycena vulgaris]